MCACVRVCALVCVRVCALVCVHVDVGVGACGAWVCEWDMTPEFTRSKVKQILIIFTYYNAYDYF